MLKVASIIILLFSTVVHAGDLSVITKDLVWLKQFQLKQPSRLSVAYFGTAPGADLDFILKETTNGTSFRLATEEEVALNDPKTLANTDVTSGQIVIFPSYFSLNRIERLATLVHESTHKFFGAASTHTACAPSLKGLDGVSACDAKIATSSYAREYVFLANLVVARGARMPPAVLAQVRTTLWNCLARIQDRADAQVLWADTAIKF